MNNDGTFNANAGRFDGVDRTEVRRQLWADLKVSRFIDTGMDVRMTSQRPNCGRYEWCQTAVMRSR